MRLLVVTACRGVVGGIETYLRGLIPSLMARGHSLALLCEHRAREGQQVIDDGFSGLPVWHFADGVSSLEDVRRWAPEVCYVQGLHDPENERAIIERYPAALYAHTYIGTCISGTKRFSFPTGAPCSRTFGKACLAMYYPRRCGGLNPLTVLRMYTLQRSRRKLLHDYRAIMVASRHMHEEFRRHGIDDERLHLLPLFPANQFPDAELPRPREMTGRILVVGRFTNVKGGTLLVPAVAAAKRSLKRQLTLVLAGDGPDLPEIRAFAQREDVPLDCFGWLGAKEREALFRSADLLAVPSTWPEPFGLLGIEAGCVGLPSVGFEVGGIPDWLHTGETGEIANGAPPTPQGLADAIVRALRDPKHYQRLRVGAWKLSQRFSRTAHLDQLDSILAHVAAS